MWLIAIGCFATVTLLIYALASRRLPVAVPIDGGLRPVSEHWLDRRLDRLQLPFGASEAIVGTGLAALGTGSLLLLWGLDAGTVVGAILAVPLLAAMALRQRLQASNLRLIEQLPDALLMMANSLKTGHTLSHVFQAMGRELPAPLGPEFARVTAALQMGQSPEAALQEMQQRLTSTEIDLLVQAILIQRETGGNLVEILTNIQGALRDRLKLKGKVRALTAQGRLSGVVIGVLPLALFAFLWTTNREYVLEFVTNPIGQQALIAAMLGQIVGFVSLQRIVNFPI